MSVWNFSSLVKSETLVGTTRLTRLLTGVISTLFTAIPSIIFSFAPTSIFESLFFSSVVKSFVESPFPAILSTLSLRKVSICVFE